MEEILFWIICCPRCTLDDNECPAPFSIENAEWDGEHCPKCGKEDYELRATAVTPSTFDGLRCGTVARTAEVAARKIRYEMEKGG